MCKCKNIECKNETEKNKIYCSLTCRNYYVNKYLRDYNKNAAGLAKDSIKKYDAEPKHCANPNCNIRIPYEKRKNNYCSSSCSASITNKDRLGNTHEISEEGLKNILKANIEKNYHIHGYKFGDYEKKPKICKLCEKPLQFAKRNNTFCSKICVVNFKRKDMNKFLIYKKDASFKFSLNQYPNEFDFSLIEKYGWYSPSNSKKPNINGVSRDHMVSIREGFNLGIDPNLLAHPANCKLMVHNDNISKNKKCSLTIIELNDRINEWNIKYNILGNTLIGSSPSSSTKK
jgi:hypothetical protein